MLRPLGPFTVKHICQVLCDFDYVLVSFFSFPNFSYKISFDKISILSYICSIYNALAFDLNSRISILAPFRLSVRPESGRYMRRLNEVNGVSMCQSQLCICVFCRRGPWSMTSLHLRFISQDFYCDWLTIRLVTFWFWG